MNAGLVATGLTALTALLVEHGFRPEARAITVLHIVDLACVACFAALQIAKLFFVGRPIEYMRSHRADFSLLFVLAIQTIVHLGLRSTPEFAYIREHGLPSPLWAFYVGTIQVYLVVIVGIRSTLLHRFLLRMRLRPAQVLVVSFPVLIVAGTLLLSLPGAHRDGLHLPPLDALFTATSAVCVTGLVVRDTGTEFSALGHFIVAALIQAGGLGMLTITGAFAVFGGRAMTRHEARTIAHALDLESDAEMRRALARVLVATFTIEAAGSALLYSAWADVIADPFHRAAWAVFHSVSAFCNAGFSLFPDHASLTGFAGDDATLGVFAGLIVLGGLGFEVLEEFWLILMSRLRRKPRATLSIHTKWVLCAAAVLVGGGAALFYVLERRGSLAAFDEPTSWVASVFQSVTLRTAGFNAIDESTLGGPAVIFSIAWMLVGGAPGGTAGGMKTTTAAALLGGLLGWPRVDPSASKRALRLTVAFLGAYVVSAGLLVIAQAGWDPRIAFEAASALGTVGLSMGTTQELSAFGKIVVCLTMLVGRVGPFALAAALLREAERRAGPLSSRQILIG